MQRTLTYWQHSCDVTGAEVQPVKWQESRDSSALVESQTRTIADRLRSVGIAPERKTDGILSIVGVCSGESEVLTAWRHINFLPSVAAGNRSQLVKRLSYFATAEGFDAAADERLRLPKTAKTDSPECSESLARARAHNARARARLEPFLRYWVVTNGQRCSVHEVRSRLMDLARSVSRFAAHPALVDYGITVELRVSEVTAERDKSGAWSYHPHANVIVSSSKRIDWQKFLSFVKDNLPGHWKDCGRLVDANEAIKYFVKPADILEHRPIELLHLFVATFGLRLATPMGNFRALGGLLRDQRVKLGKTLSADRQEWKWCFVRLRDPAKTLCPPSAARDNMVMGLLPPSPRFSSRFEPCVLVRNFRGNVGDLLTSNELDKLFAPARMAWQTRRAIPFTPSPQLSEDSAPRMRTMNENYAHAPP